MPSYETNGESFYRNDYVWNSSTRVYDAVEYSDYEKQILCEYNNFWTKLLNSKLLRHTENGCIYNISSKCPLH